MKHAFKLAFEDDRGMHTSDYGYLSQDAAEEAAPTLNLGRFFRGRPAYKHLLELAGEKPVGIRELEAA